MLSLSGDSRWCPFYMYGVASVGHVQIFQTNMTDKTYTLFICFIRNLSVSLYDLYGTRTLQCICPVFVRLVSGDTMSHFSRLTRLAPVLKTIFHQCVISYTCS